MFEAVFDKKICGKEKHDFRIGSNVLNVVKRFWNSGQNHEERRWKKHQKSVFKGLKHHFDLQIYEEMG